MEWHAFELHPEIPEAGFDLSARPWGIRAGYYEQLRDLAQEDGLAFRPPARVPNSHRALEAAEFAGEQGAFVPYHRALFEAYFGHGRDIGDGAVLAELGATVGLDAAAMREPLESRRYAGLVDDRTDEARSWGITGTPTFVFRGGERRFALVGAQEYAVFQSVAQRMGAESRTKKLGPRTATEPM